MAKDRAGAFFGSWIVMLAGAIAGTIGQAEAEPADTEAFSVSPAAMAQVKPRTGEKLSQAALVERGRRIFETETFGGNGRTCATCHPVANNFTLDPKYIATLKSDDPLFVAEYNPALAKLENPAMLRRHGLITENVDGMTVPGVLRSVPHVLGLGLSTTPAPRFSLTEMTGWSGDGAPGDGSLRQFAIGAVSQHLTKSLAREPGKDFRVPSDDELDALLAYQLSLGQQVLLNVEPGEEDELKFSDAAVEHGKNLFDTPARKGINASCFSCHYKTGANDEALDVGGHGNNFATGTNTLRNAPDCAMPADGGFGKGPVTPVAASAACGTRSAASRLGRGNGKFMCPRWSRQPRRHRFFTTTALRRSRTRSASTRPIRLRTRRPGMARPSHSARRPLRTSRRSCAA